MGTNLNYHKCGHPIIIEDKFDGRGYVSVFKDGEANSTDQTITHCPRCKEAIKPSEFGPVIATVAQERISEMARAMANANPDAAEELAKHLAYEAEQRKKARGFGIEIRFNLITEKAEVRMGE